MRRFFIAAVMFFPVLVFAAEQNFLPKLKYTAVQEKLEIAETGSVTELSNSGIKLTPGSASEALAVAGKEFLWKPSELTSRTTGGADIYTTLLTSDGSAAVVCERVGGTGNPNGLRIVVTDVASGKVIRVSRVYEYELQYAKLTDDTTLFAVAAASGKKDQEWCFITVDLIAGEVNASAVFTGKADGVAVGGNNIYILSSADKRVTVYGMDSFAEKAVCKIENPAAVSLAVSPAGNLLAVYGGNMIELYNGRENNNTLYLRQKFTFPDEEFSHCIMGDENGGKIVFCSPGNPAKVLMNGKLVSLKNIVCGEVFVSDPQSGTLVLENRLRELVIFRLPQLTASAKYSPRKMRPATRNDNVALHILPGKAKQLKLLLADHRGNLWKLDLVGKRGKKYPVLIIDDTGLRKR